MASNFSNNPEGFGGPEPLRPCNIEFTDAQLLQTYDAARAEAQIPGVPLTGLIGLLPEAPSPYMDELYARTQGDISLMAREMRRTAAERGGEVALPLVPAFGRTAAIARLTRDVYPATFRLSASVPGIEAALQRQGADTLSFLALGDTGTASIYAAACRAYVGTSKFDEQSTTEVVRLDHMLVAPAWRRSLLGIHMFRELVVRAESLGLQTVEMLTRESTSYRGFKAGSMLARAITKLGYTVEDLGVKQVKGEGEEAECIFAIRMSKE